MPKKGENIYKRKDGRWEGRYIKEHHMNGKAIYGYVYARSYSDVKNKLLLKKQMQQAEKITADKSVNSMTFGRAAADWTAYKRVYIKESTYMKYSNLLNNYILPVFEKMLLSHMTAEIMNNYVNELLTRGGESGTGLSAKTVSDILSLIRNILRYVSNNGQTIAFDICTVMVKQSTKNMRVFTNSEQDILCRYIYNNIDIKGIGILVCLFTGIRVGELCALKWTDISLEDKTIYVHQTMQRIQIPDSTGAKTKIVITSPKSASSIRMIPLPDILAYIIEKNYTVMSGFFLTGDNNQWIEPRTMQNYFKRVLEKCFIKDANFHALRHTFATRCIELGFDVKSLSEILGHASVNITMNRYVHPTMDLKRKNMQKLSDLLTVR